MTSTQDDVYSENNIALFEAIYGKNLISLGKLDAIDNMFSDLEIKGLTALDVGFGLGGVAFYLAKQYQMHICGVEIHHWMVTHAKHATPPEIRHLVNFATYNAQGKIPFPASGFDLVYSKGVLNHVHEKAPLFRQIAEALKQNGIFVIADWVFLEPEIDHSKPLVRETKATYQEVLEKAGFSEIAFRNDSALFKGYAENLLTHLKSIQQNFEKTYGSQTYQDLILQHENLIGEIENKRRFAVRVVAKKVSI